MNFATQSVQAWKNVEKVKDMNQRKEQQWEEMKCHCKYLYKNAHYVWSKERKRETSKEYNLTTTIACKFNHTTKEKVENTQYSIRQSPYIHLIIYTFT